MIPAKIVPVKQEHINYISNIKNRNSVAILYRKCKKQYIDSEYVGSFQKKLFLLQKLADFCFCFSMLTDLVTEVLSVKIFFDYEAKCCLKLQEICIGISQMTQTMIPGINLYASCHDKIFTLM